MGGIKGGKNRRGFQKNGYGIRQAEEKNYG